MLTCPKCNEINTEHTRILEREEVFPVRGEPTTVLSNVRVCTSCGEEIYDEELDSVNLTRAYDVYRNRHKLIMPSEITRMREYYGITQRSLSALLGLGEISIHRYENGSLPDEAHNQLLRFIQNPWNMQTLMLDHGDRLNASQRAKLLARLAEIIHQEMPDRVVALVSAEAKQEQPSSLTGFRKFSPETLMEMMVFFASKAEGVYKTKLNKLLWYADFWHFHLHSTSISGSVYIHMPYGPVADQYEFYLSYLLKDNAITVEEQFFGNGSGELFCFGRQFHSELFDASSLEVMEAVHNYFRTLGSREISLLSHEEDAYKKTRMGEKISYQFADRLKANISEMLPVTIL